MLIRRIVFIQKLFFKCLKNNEKIQCVLHRLLPVLTFLILVFVLPITAHQMMSSMHGMNCQPQLFKLKSSSGLTVY